MNVGERRAARRTLTQELLVRVDGYCLHKFGYAKNISSTGMRLRTFTNCEPFSFDGEKKIKVGFILPGKDVEISCEAEPVWRERPVGGSISTMVQGIKFTGLDSELADQINKWVTCDA